MQTKSFLLLKFFGSLRGFSWLDGRATPLPCPVYPCLIVSDMIMIIIVFIITCFQSEVSDIMGLQILETVGPRRDEMDACIILPSMPAVMWVPITQTRPLTVSRCQLILGLAYKILHFSIARVCMCSD
jgi:hypothetical protein